MQSAHGAPVTPNPALGDAAQWFHPAVLWSGAEIRAAPAPLWVPHAYTGAPVSLRWAPGPPGEIPLALVVVPRGGDPLARFAWTFRPALAWISAHPPGPALPLELLRLAPLAAVTLLSFGIVLFARKPFLG